MNPTNLYDLDLRAAGVKDRELSRLIADVKQRREQHADRTAAAEEARRNLATLPDRLRDHAAAAMTAGEDPSTGAEDLIAETERAAQIAEASAEASALLLAEAEREVERHLAGLGSTHRGSAREAAGKHRPAAIEAADDLAAKIDRVLEDLVAVMQLQALPTAGNVLPSQDRRYLGNEYANHRIRTLIREIREEIEALVPPSEEAFHDATSSQPFYLHRPPRERERWEGMITTQVGQ